MKKKFLLSLTVAILLISAFAQVALTIGPTQPPVDTTTLYVGREGWGPQHADPVRAHDKYSQELIFNAYDRLIMFGEPVTNQWRTWAVHEQYWEFQPNLATNVPERVEVTADFTNTSFVWTIVIRNEIPIPPDWIFMPICTWWEDDLAQPFNSYHITDWIDNGDEFVSPCDYIFLNDYWWAPEIPEEVFLKDARWWHVEDVQEHIPGELYKMILTHTTREKIDPEDPERANLGSPKVCVTPYYENDQVDKNTHVHLDASEFVPGEVIVGFEDVSVGTLQAIVARGGTIIEEISVLNALVVKVSVGNEEEFIRSTRSISGFKYAERNGIMKAVYTPNDPYWNQLWNMRIIEADDAWDIHTGSTSVVTAIVDSGVDYNHEDLASNYVPGGYDWVNDDSLPLDDWGHGTHCAGITAAVMDNNKGVVGVAQCSIWAEKVLNSTGSGSWADVASGITHATDNGVDVISMSLGGYGYSTVVDSACTYAWNNGVLIVAAAGNDNMNIDVNPFYPACYSTVIAVSATDDNDQKASYSNWGNAVELAAPGSSIYSTVPGNSYAYKSGTSMSCPHVAGVAALTWSYYSSLTNAQLRNRLRKSVDDLGSPGKDVYYGFGRINAYKPLSTPQYSRGTWWTSPSYPNRYFQCVGFVDNNPVIEGLSECDVVYMMEYEWVPVIWEKIGEGWTLLPATCRTWHVLDYEIDDSTVTLHLHRWYYDFNIRTDPVIYFINDTGGIVDTFDIFDAEYSFERGLVQDQYDSPMWKFYKPLFDQVNSDWWDTGDLADAIELAYLIEDAIEIISTDPPILRINLGIDFPDIAFKQILCGTWASIVSREFSILIGCWNGELFFDLNQNCFSDWFEIIRHTDPSPYDAQWSYAGTGPYYVSVVDDVNRVVVLEKNDYYWMGWPAPQRKAYLERVDLEYISEWSTRRDAFTACQIDICDVPTAYMTELLNVHNEPAYPEIVTIKNIYPCLTMDAVIFTFAVNPASPYIGTGETGPEGISPNFFNDTNNRKAFAYAFNHSAYLDGTYHGEAVCRETPLISGLAPDYYSYGPDPPYTYDDNQAMAEACLVASGAWETGFYVVMVYDAGNVEAMMACMMIRDFFWELDPITHRFQVDIAEIDWSTFRNQFEARNLPVCVMPWHANYADADDFMGPFMHSDGYFAYFQGYTGWNGWTTPGPATGLDKDVLVDLAVKTPDGPERAALYKDLEDMYIEDCPSYPIAEPLGRRWQKYWVKGWYHNALYPSDYYYHMYKEDTCWCNVAGPTVGMPDLSCSVRDINWICGHFGAKAPYVAVPYDTRWAPGTYSLASCDVYGDRKVDMRDIGLACDHFMHTNEP